MGEVSTSVYQAVDLIAEFEGNSVAAVLKYSNKQITVTGEVAGIDTDYLNNVYITISGGDFVWTEIRCYVSDSAEVLGVQAGTQITVEGSFRCI